MSSTYPMTPQMSSYSSYPTQFSQYPQPQPQQGQIPVEQPTNFRSEYQGILHGLNCWVNLLYAGLGMFSYGKTFYKMSVGVLKTISQAALKLLMKVFGFKFLGKVIEWLGSFRRENNSDYDNLWSGMAPAQINTRLGKMLLCLRVLLLFGLNLFYIR